MKAAGQCILCAKNGDGREGEVALITLGEVTTSMILCARHALPLRTLIDQAASARPGSEPSELASLKTDMEGVEKARQRYALLRHQLDRD